jgi:hypothetical protein
VVNRIAFARSDEAVRGRSRSPPTPPAVHTAERVRQQIEAGRTRRARRTNQELDGAFQAHADEVGGDRRIPRARLQAALREFHAGASEAEVDHFLLMRGGPADGSVDLEDFREAARTAWAVETWAQSLPLAQLLADALPESLDHHRLRAASSLTGGEIRDIAEGVGRALQALLTEHVTSLRRSFRAMDNQAAGVPQRDSEANVPAQGCKFSADISRMDCGDVKGFHRGLQKRVGLRPRCCPTPGSVPIPGSFLAQGRLCSHP